MDVVRCVPVSFVAVQYDGTNGDEILAKMPNDSLSLVSDNGNVLTLAQDTGMGINELTMAVGGWVVMSGTEEGGYYYTGQSYHTDAEFRAAYFLPDAP